MTKDDADVGVSVAKGAVMVLGALAVLGVAWVFFLPLAKLGLLVALGAGVGYFGYRAYGKTKALGGGKTPKALISSRDFDRKMRELDALDEKLDAEIRKRS